MNKLHVEEIFDGISVLPPGNFEDCAFTNCSFSGADFSGVSFEDCRFSDCDLSNVRLAETAMKPVWLANCKLIGLHFEDCADFLFAIHCTGCQLELSTFRERDLRRSSFTTSRLMETDFTGADLQEVAFHDCDLSRSIFERTDLRKADFSTASNYQLSPEDNRLRGAKFSPDGLAGLLTDYGIVVVG